MKTIKLFIMTLAMSMSLSFVTRTEQSFTELFCTNPAFRKTVLFNTAALATIMAAPSFPVIATTGGIVGSYLTERYLAQNPINDNESILAHIHTFSEPINKATQFTAQQVATTVTNAYTTLSPHAIALAKAAGRTSYAALSQQLPNATTAIRNGVSSGISYVRGLLPNITQLQQQPVDVEMGIPSNATIEKLSCPICLEEDLADVYTFSCKHQMCKPCAIRMYGNHDPSIFTHTEIDRNGNTIVYHGRYDEHGEPAPSEPCAHCEPQCPLCRAKLDIKILNRDLNINNGYIMRMANRFLVNPIRTAYHYVTN